MALLSVALLAACSQNGGRDGGIKKQEAGTIVGAIGGALVGSNVGKGKGNIAAIAAGTLLGAYLGNELGSTLDRADMAYFDRTTQRTLEAGKNNQTSTWVNPDTGNRGTITPTKTYQASAGVYCREYTQTISVGGQNQQAFGKACRQPDGTWKIKQ
jgi:surface antigen